MNFFDKESKRAEIIILLQDAENEVRNDGLQNSGTVNFNDLGWLTVDMVASDMSSQKLPPIPQNDGR